VGGGGRGGGGGGYGKVEGMGQLGEVVVEEGEERVLGRGIEVEKVVDLEHGGRRLATLTRPTTPIRSFPDYITTKTACSPTCSPPAASSAPWQSQTQSPPASRAAVAPAARTSLLRVRQAPPTDTTLTRLRADAPHLRTRTLPHLLRQRLQIDPALQRHLRTVSDAQHTRPTPTLREWIRRMLTRASGPGGGNSIFRSIRPGRSSAESRISAPRQYSPGRPCPLTYPVRRHDHLDVLRRLEPVQLVQQLQHRPLHLRVAPARPALPPRTPDRVDLVHENNARRVLPRHHKQLPHHPTPLPNILLHQLRPRHPYELAVRVMRHRPRQQRLPRPRRSVQQHALGLRDPERLEQLRVLHRQLDHLLDLLDLLVQPPHHLIRAVRHLLHHHQRHQRVHLVR
jgi:hypothetical protein